jgi:PIN domain nuclease of toxin-antitoxin system
MKYLLDTHTFIWTVAESKRLSERAKKEIRDPENEVFISAVNLWEIAIKTRMNKIDLGGVQTDDLIGLAEEMGIQRISLSPEEAISYGKLEESSQAELGVVAIDWGERGGMPVGHPAQGG